MLLSPAESVAVKVAFRAPSAVGVKVTSTLQLLPGATAEPLQLLGSWTAKSPLSFPPSEKLAIVIAAEDFSGLEIVTGRGLLVAPETANTTFPKFKVLGVTTNAEGFANTRAGITSALTRAMVEMNRMRRRTDGTVDDLITSPEGGRSPMLPERRRFDQNFRLKSPFQLLYRGRSRISSACVSLPNETVIDGEIIAFDKYGRPLQRPPEPSRRSTAVAVLYLRPDDPRTPSLRRKRPGGVQSCAPRGRVRTIWLAWHRQMPVCQSPEPRKGRWGEGLTAEDMKHCRWLRPRPVGAFEFLEWTPGGHLRHPKFAALRDDKKAPDVIRDRLASQFQ